jgi:hypothetical protein
MLDPIKNFAKVTVSTGYDASATSIVLASGDGAKLPAPATDGAFNLVWWNSTSYPDPADDPNKEIVRCTARSSDTLTVTRAQEGTSATVKNLAGKTYKMILALTANTMSDINLGKLAGLTLDPTGRNLKTWWNFEDFIIGTNARLWYGTSSGTGSSALPTLGTALRPGIHRLSTGTTNTGYAGVANSGYLTDFLFGAGIYTLEADIYITTLSDGTETYTLRFGFGDALSIAPVDGAYFRYTDTGTTPNWYRNTVSNTTLTSTDTGVAVVAGAWIRLKAVVNAAGTSVEYFINGISVGTNTTNIPTGTGRETGAIYSIVKSAGTTARTTDIDWAWIHVELSTSR